MSRPARPGGLGAGLHGGPADTCRRPVTISSGLIPPACLGRYPARAGPAACGHLTGPGEGGAAGLGPGGCGEPTVPGGVLTTTLMSIPSSAVSATTNQNRTSLSTAAWLTGASWPTGPACWASHLESGLPPRFLAKLSRHWTRLIPAALRTRDRTPLSDSIRAPGLRVPGWPVKGNRVQQDQHHARARPGVTIRTGVADDGQSLASIDRATWSSEVSPVPLWPPGTPFFDDRTAPRDVLVACEAEHVVGYVKLRPAPIVASSGHVQEINGLAVAPDHQGRGIGHLLLTAARHEAIRRGARRITLRVLGTNTRAQGLYLAHGYRVEGRLKGQFLLQGRYVDDIFMALELPVRT